MARVKRGVTSHAKHKKTLRAAKGFYGRRVHALPQLAVCLRDHGLTIPDDFGGVACHRAEHHVYRRLLHYLRVWGFALLLRVAGSEQRAAACAAIGRRRVEHGL